MAKRKTCVFCGCSDCKISNEHAWPNWARKLVGPPGMSTVSGFRQRGQDVGSVRFSMRDDMGVQVNRICREKCNSGWMSALETVIEPILTPMIEGAPVVLTPESQVEIARWVMKTAMVFEFSSAENPFFTFEERDALRQRRLAASVSWTAIWLSRYSGPHMSLSHGTHMTFAPTPDAESAMPGFACTLSLGRLLCQMLSVRVPQGFQETLAIPTAKEWHQRTVAIWPARRDVSWPPLEDIDEATYEMLNRRFRY